MPYFTDIKHLCMLAGCLGLIPCPGTATTFDEVGYTYLLNELGAGIPDGAGVQVTQGEAPVSGNYMPNVADAEFTGKTINNITNSSSTASGHATAVGRNFYGSTSSLAPGVTVINVYEANDWLGSGFLKTLSVQSPAVDGSRIQNHSWIFGTQDLLSEAYVQDALRRVDFMVARDNVLVVCGVNNGSGSAQYEGFSNAYNVIAVGRLDGAHASGATTLDEPGRTVPHIVALGSYTSFTTPLVSSAAALLVEHARNNAPLANGEDELVLKALLMAGATKAEFPSWSRTTTQPIDAVYGAGDLNVFNSYHILDAGEHAAAPSTAVPSTGWDLASISAGGVARYFFEVQPSEMVTGFSVMLCWNRQVTKTGPSFNVANSDLRLRLKESSSFVPGTLIDSSDSPLDNFEHVFTTGALAPGQYVLEVESDLLDLATTEYALAWQLHTLEDTYAEWAVKAFDNAVPAADRDPEDDPDGDGLNNFEEYAKALDPNAPDIPGSHISMTPDSAAGTVTFTYRRRVVAADTAFSVENSPILSNSGFADVAALVLGENTVTDPALAFATVTLTLDIDPLAVSPQFLRLVIEQLP